MEVAVWLLVGASGNALIWFVFVYLDKYSQQRCPTPKAIFCMFLFALLGPVSLFVGLVTFAAHWITSERPAKKKSWWTTPLCNDRT